jgi:hypothetical protein
MKLPNIWINLDCYRPDLGDKIEQK